MVRSFNNLTNVFKKSYFGIQSYNLYKALTIKADAVSKTWDAYCIPCILWSLFEDPFIILPYSEGNITLMSV